MNKYIQEDKIQSLIRKLNATYPDISQWTKKRAQKKHIDMFEQVINEGELYFRLKIDNNYSNDLKLSCMSMDKFLFTLFAPLPSWYKQSSEVISDRLEETRKIINKLRQ